MKEKILESLWFMLLIILIFWAADLTQELITMLQEAKSNE